MKKGMLVIVMLGLVIALCSGCAAIEQAMHPGQTSIAGVWVDNEAVNEYNFTGVEAEMKGDTYCEKCDKVNPGRARICKYCGQYI